MNLILKQLNHWDDELIQEMINFKRDMQSNLPTYFPEQLKDYKKLLHPDSPFSKDFQWTGFFIYNRGTLVAQAILSWRNGTQIGNLGFIDVICIM